MHTLCAFANGFTKKSFLTPLGKAAFLCDNIPMRAFISQSASSFAFLRPGYQKANALDPLGNTTLLDYQINVLRNNGVTEIYLAYPAGNKIIPEKYKNEGDIYLISVPKSLGNAGALCYVPKDEDILFVPGDLVFDVCLKRFFEFHKAHEGYLTCLSHPEPHPEQKDVLLLQNNINGFIILPKETSSARDFYYSNLIPTELSILSPDLLAIFDEEDPYPLNFREDVFDPTLANGCVVSYYSAEYVQRISGKAEYLRIQEDVKAGIPERKNASRPQKAFFLDRDGTINVFGDFVVRPDMLTLIPGAAKAIAKINRAGYLAICVTNQPVVARGETTMQEMTNILANLEMMLGKEGAYLDAIYFCPHYPRKFPESNEEYTMPCTCRKPGIGLLEEAKKAFNIDYSESWFIGDTTRDVQTGLNARTHTALLLGGDPHYNKRYGDAAPEKTFQTLEEAIDDILGE